MDLSLPPAEVPADGLPNRPVTPSAAGPKRISGWVHALVIWLLLGLGADVASHALLKLHLPFAWTVYVAALLPVAAYVAVGLWLRRTRLGRAAWAVGFVVGVLFGPISYAIPNVVEEAYAQRVPLPRWLEPEERVALEAVFPHPYIEMSSSSHPTPHLLIRRSDYGPALAQFIKSLRSIPDPPDAASP